MFHILSTLLPGFMLRWKYQHRYAFLFIFQLPRDGPTRFHFQSMCIFMCMCLFKIFTMPMLLLIKFLEFLLYYWCFKKLDFGFVDHLIVSVHFHSILHFDGSNQDFFFLSSIYYKTSPSFLINCLCLVGLHRCFSFCQ